MRVIFRFVFTVPLLVLSADGIRGSHPLNRNPFVVDLCILLSGLGCVLSSSITLLIFFPISTSPETEPPNQASMLATKNSDADGYARPAMIDSVSPNLKTHHTYRDTEFIRGPDGVWRHVSAMTADDNVDLESQQEFISPPSTTNPTGLLTPQFRPRLSWRHSAGASLTGPSQTMDIVLDISPRPPLHHYITTYTSPIDLVELPHELDDLPRAI